jgi:hypothetical protein
METPTKLQQFSHIKLSDEVLSIPKVLIMLNEAGSWNGFLDQLTNVTGSIPGEWPSKPFYDSSGNGDYPLRNPLLLRAGWSNPYNQEQLRKDDFDYFLIPSEAPEQDLGTVSDSVSYVGVGVLINRLPKLLTVVPWAVLTLSEDWMVFAAARKHAAWVVQIRDWCEKHGYIA